MVPAELTVPRPDRRQERRASDALRAFGHRHRLPLLATLPLIPLYAVWWVFLATGGGDLAAQQAWADFASRHGGSAYGLFWYGGVHTANYSVISPYLMALLGVRTVTLVSGLAASWLVAVLMVRCGVGGGRGGGAGGGGARGGGGGRGGAQEKTTPPTTKQRQ
ncbi:hypothetical protein ACFWR9_22560, partial [Streptomyces sp. NPDC058534]